MWRTMNKSAQRTFSTPMMQQYMKVKNKYKDCLLFFRLGDFYELFLDDAEVGAKELGITLTQRPRGKDGRIPMAGVPFHAADSYISKLVKAGHKVAICEQVSEPDNKGIVDREVVRIVTPGTVMDEKSLEDRENNYTISLSLDHKLIGIAVSDVSTGDFQSYEFEYKNKYVQILSRELSTIRPLECILSEKLYKEHQLLKILSVHNVNVYKFEDWEKYTLNPEKILKRHFGLKSLGVFGIDNKHHAITASAALLGYLKHTQKDKVGHIRKIRSYSQKDYLLLDSSTIANLELFSTIREQRDQGSLVYLLDQTSTAIGGRLLRDWVRRPLRRKEKIIQRLDAVEELNENPLLRNKIRKELGKLYDIERILSRLSVGIGIPADLVNLKQSIKHILSIKEILDNFKSQKIKKVNKGINQNIEDVANLIDNHLNENAIGEKELELIRSGVNSNLDTLRNNISGEKKWIASLEQKERKRTGISSLKVKFNKVFGYYIEISKSNLDSVPEDYIRKQTIVNAERYITPELKEKEEKILRAEEKIEKLEEKILQELINKVLEHTQYIQDSAKLIAQLDCLATFAQIASSEQYVKPQINTKGKLSLKDGRHPVVEKMLQMDDKQFVPNDSQLDQKANQLLILTGPNMAGKSVYIRQVAVITLLAHMGSFVPARSADICLVDRIFVRSGASDVIASGLSTFMVEMVETAHILNHASDKSLIVVDEIGRGTSTYDGISIAWAVAEYLVKNTRAKTLFATHYHELQMLEERYSKGIKNYQMAVEEENGEPIFLYKLKQGGTSHSYAVAVAKLAGVPVEVTQNAEQILEQLENNRFISNGEVKQFKTNSHFENGKVSEKLTKYLEDLDVDKITPVEALNKLNKLKRELKNED